jgi:hypothetical protein
LRARGRSLLGMGGLVGRLACRTFEGCVLIS